MTHSFSDRDERCSQCCSQSSENDEFQRKRNLPRSAVQAPQPEDFFFSHKKLIP